MQVSVDMPAAGSRCARDDRVRPVKLLIAVPAKDEEQSIGSIIERCLEARAFIVAGSPVTDVEITVVSDGSTDRTVEIARGYTDRIRLIVFEKNRGYGAAIQEAWKQSDADLLGFLDADGTCDPRFFAPLCDELIKKDADVLLGSRMNEHSRMPVLRRAGNLLFAWMLSLFSLSRVHDVASGMRVARRSSLPKLFPLPDGLHFTPALSARAILSRRVRILEIEMPYHERSGRSKLRPVADGLRFLRVILRIALTYRPSGPLGVIAGALLALTLGLMIYPTFFYLKNGALHEWMIYRFLVAQLLSTLATLTWLASYLGRKAADISLSDEPTRDKYHGLSGWLLSRKWFLIVPVSLILIGLTFVVSAFFDFVATGEVEAHWSRFVAMMFCLSNASVLVVTKVIDHSLNLLADQLTYLKSAETRGVDAARSESVVW